MALFREKLGTSMGQNFDDAVVSTLVANKAPFSLRSLHNPTLLHGWCEPRGTFCVAQRSNMQGSHRQSLDNNPPYRHFAGLMHERRWKRGWTFLIALQRAFETTFD